jgi:DNA-nicking Smr family endonuclease
VKRRLGPDEVALWSVVASTVRPMAGKTAPKAEAEAITAPSPAKKPPPGPMPKRLKGPAPAPPKRAPAQPIRTLHSIEPNRERRVARGTDVLEARIDLHGLDQDSARAALERFLLRAQAEGYRAALVITGKGPGGDGVLRRRLPDWLLAHPLRGIIAGVSEARRRHGGKGAVYVALKRKA